MWRQEGGYQLFLRRLLSSPAVDTLLRRPLCPPVAVAAAIMTAPDTPVPQLLLRPLRPDDDGDHDDDDDDNEDGGNEDDDDDGDENDASDE